MRKIFLLLLIIIMGFNIKAYAHPGNTDANGGHYCWTNCEQWGFTYGEYHLHNPKTNITPVEKIDQNIPHTYKEGYDEAYSFWYETALSDLKNNQAKGWNATWTDYNSNYSDGYREGFNKAIEDANKDFKDYQFDRGVEDGIRHARLGMTMGYITSNDPIADSQDYINGYNQGNSDERELLKEKNREDLENELASIEIPERFQDNYESFILGYQTGFYDSETGYNYDDEPESEYAKGADEKQYMLGYKNGWNDEGGSLPIQTELNLIYINYIKGNELFALIPGVGLVGFLVGRRKKKTD